MARSRLAVVGGVVLLWSRLVLAQLGPCVGDCEQDGSVTVSDLIEGVNVVLGARPLSDCQGFDVDGNDRLTIDELVKGVRALLDGCTPAATLTPTAQATTPTASPTASASPTATTVRQPNILIISLDDTRADGVDRMPTLLSRLAAEGVTFTNSFVPFSSCAPSRASLFSGRYALHHGTRGVGGPLGGAHTFRESGADRETIATWFQAAGYRTGLFGKYINGYATTEEHEGPGGTFYVPPGWDRWRGMMSNEHYGGIHGPTYVLVDEYGQLATYDDHTTDAQYSTDLLAGELRRFIADAVSEGRPFLGVWTPIASHGDTPGLAPHPADRHFDFFRGLPLWRPPNWMEADVSDKPLWTQNLYVTQIGVSLTDEIRQRAYETLLAVDEELDLILDQLRDLGIDENTVVLFTSDNGVGWGEHRLLAQGKGDPYEECIRVPMMVRYPRVVQNVPRTIDAAVLNIDIAPTVAALAGVPIPVAVDGISFAPWVVGSPQPSWRDRFLLEQWRLDRDGLLTYTGQVTDGDRLRLLHGDPWTMPRPSTVFEFDDNGVVTDGAIAVPIGADADASFSNLGDAVVANVPFTGKVQHVARGEIISVDESPSNDGVYWLEEVDDAQVMTPQYPLPDFFGLRDVGSGYTYVEYETGEVELYDLHADPSELENKADDAAYAATRAQLAEALAELLAEP